MLDGLGHVGESHISRLLYRDEILPPSPMVCFYCLAHAPPHPHLSIPSIPYTSSVMFHLLLLDLILSSFFFLASVNHNVKVLLCISEVIKKKILTSL